MYIGQFEHSIDSKNRVFLPARFRAESKTFVIARGLENCLFIYDIEGWQKVLVKLDNLALKNKMQERAFKRALLSGAYELLPDAQGRIIVPQNLKEHAKIKSDIVIIGVGSRLELWDKSSWNKYYKQQADASFSKLAGKLEI